MKHFRALAVAWIAALPLLLAACSPGSPEERVAASRAKYSATINGWVVEEQPRAMTLEVVESALPEEGVEAEELAPVEPVAPGPSTVILDIQLWHNSAEALPGITLDITHADHEEREKGSYQMWVDTSRLARGQHVQVNHRLDGVEVEPGDRFSAQVRHPVPAAERASYREFREAAGAPE